MSPSFVVSSAGLSLKKETSALRPVQDARQPKESFLSAAEQMFSCGLQIRSTWKMKVKKWLPFVRRRKNTSKPAQTPVGSGTKEDTHISSELPEHNVGFCNLPLLLSDTS